MTATEIAVWRVCALLALAVAEIVASSAWFPAYFRNGLRIFRIELPYRPPLDAMPDVDALAAAFAGGAALPLKFKVLDSDQIAFREQILQVKSESYTPIMRGLIAIDRLGGRVVVSGRLNWTVLLLLAAPFAILAAARAAFFSLFIAAICAVNYAYQARLYRRVAERVASESVSVSHEA